MQRKSKEKKETKNVLAFIIKSIWIINQKSLILVITLFRKTNWSIITNSQ